MSKIRHHTKKIRGLKTAWLESGSKTKPIILFIHGFPDDAHVWNEQIKYFQKHFHIIAPFLRGVEKSEKARDQNRYSFEAVALDILTILRHIDPTAKKPIYLAGHDIGTPHAWYLAHLLGDRLKGLIIINGAHILQFFDRLTHNLHQTLKSWYMYFFFMPVLPEMTIKAMPDFLKKKIKLAGGMPKKYIHKNDAGINGAHELVRHYRGLFHGMLDAIKNKNGYKLDKPVLSISSIEDQFMEPASIQELEAYTTAPTVRIIEGKHWVQLEDPERVNKLIEKFIAHD